MLSQRSTSPHLRQLRFTDSAQVWLASLDKLVVVKQPRGFQVTARYEPAEERRSLLMRRYPYEYMDAWKSFTKPQTVWAVFACRSLRDYYTSIGLFWDALLEKTGVKFLFLIDYDQLLFVEKGLRASILVVSQRYARANNTQDEGYDPSKPNSPILYHDANNLYGWAMSKPSPGVNIDGVCERLAGAIAEYPADIPEDYTLKLDLEYPEELHNVYRGVWWFKKMDIRVPANLGVCAASTEVEKLVPTSATENAMCSTVASFSFTYRWTCA